MNDLTALLILAAALVAVAITQAIRWREKTRVQPSDYFPMLDEDKYIHTLFQKDGATICSNPRRLPELVAMDDYAKFRQGLPFCQSCNYYLKASFAVMERS